MVVEAAIHAAGNFCGLGTEGRASTLQEDYDHDASHVSLGVGSEPSVARACLGAGSSLAQDFFFVEIRRAGCALCRSSPRPPCRPKFQE